jgi:hypothetical protein
MRFEAMWPVEDHNLTVRELANEAMPDLMRMAREHGAVIFGPPRFTVSESRDEGLVLHASACARPIPRSAITHLHVVRRPEDERLDQPRKRAECGTDGGYYRHKRTDKTEACAACLAAHAEVNRERAAQKRKEAG